LMLRGILPQGGRTFDLNSMGRGTRSCTQFFLAKGLEQ
jgi:hypothetical protein